MSGFTTDLLVGVAELLAGADVALWHSDGTPYAAGQTGIVLRDLPATPDRVVTLTGYGVDDHVALADVTVGVQVRCRAGRDPRDVDDLADAVYEVLHGLEEQTVGGISVVQMWRQSWTPMGRDGNDRHERADNYYVQAMRPGVGRRLH